MNLGMLLWGLITFSLVGGLVSFVLMELSLDKTKRETDGTIRVKRKGFVIRFVYNSFLSRLDFKFPNNWCQLYWGIYFGLIVDVLIILAVLFVLMFLFVMAVEAVKNPTVFLKIVGKFCVAFGVVGFIFCIARIVAKTLAMPVIQDLMAKTKGLCPPVKLVE